MEPKALCRICGRTASGVHYGVMSCRGCKVFFKRGIRRKSAYICYIGNCSTLASFKNQCKGCRFKKCLAMGMEIRGSKTSSNTCIIPTATRPYHNCLSSENLTLPCLGCDYYTPVPEYHPTEKTECLYNPAGYFSGGSFTSLSTVHQGLPIPFPPMKFPAVTQLLSNEEFLLFEPFETAAWSDTASTSSDGGYQSRASTPCGSTNLSINSRRLSFDPIKNLEFVPLSGKCIGSLEANRHQAAVTVYAVETAVQRVFGDHIACWTLCRNRALLYGEVVNQPETTLDNMVTAANKHTIEITMRIQKFASMLPGMDDLLPSERTCSTAGWKLMVCWMLHHSPFMTEVETYITIGQEQYQYCRYWQDMFAERQRELIVFVYRFGTEFRKIGLTQTEQYLLMAIVMFEPDADYRADQSLRIKLIHRHYIDVLMDVIKRRCSETSQLVAIGKSLQRFFDILKLVHRLNSQFFSPSPRKPQPALSNAVGTDESTIRCAVVALARMTITRYLGSGNFRRRKSS